MLFSGINNQCFISAGYLWVIDQNIKVDNHTLIVTYGLFTLHGDGTRSTDILYRNFGSGRERNQNLLFPTVLVQFPIPVLVLPLCILFRRIVVKFTNIFATQVVLTK